MALCVLLMGLCFHLVFVVSSGYDLEISSEIYNLNIFHGVEDISSLEICEMARIFAGGISHAHSCLH